MGDSFSAKTNKVLICYCLADPLIPRLFTTPTSPLSGPQCVLYDTYRRVSDTPMMNDVNRTLTLSRVNENDREVSPDK